jgi:hypothetical protein
MFRYNFNPTAGSSFGYQHSEEALAKMRGARPHFSPSDTQRAATPEEWW